MSRFGRRELLSGAALAGAAVLGCRPGRDGYRIDKPPLPGNRARAGEERWVFSTCALCDAGCGIKVRVVEGRAVKIEGNPEHPVNRGGLCSRGQAALQTLYQPQRVRSPLRRLGERGDGSWKLISWDDAIGEIAAKLAKLRAAGHPERLALIDGAPASLTYELWTRFMLAFGSPNHIGMGSARAAGIKLANRYTMGCYALPTLDLAGAHLVLALGAEQIESSGQTMHFMRAASGPQRPRVVCVSPRRPVGRIDEWIPIAPGSHGALALSLAHVLVRDGLFNRDFVHRVVSGFSRSRNRAGVEQPGFEGLIRGAYAPGQTQDLTGIPAATVERLAHELAKQRPAVVTGDGSATAASNGLATAMAIATLNALLGNIERGGPHGLPRYLPPNWEAPAIDAIAAAGRVAPRIDGAATTACPLGTSRVQAVPEAIAQSKPYPIEALFLRGADPVSVLPGRRAWLAAIQRVPFLVRIASWLDESAREADLVLPESLPLETWDVVHPATDSGALILSLRQPVVTPLAGTRQAGDIVLALAAGLGGSIGRSLPWQSGPDAMAKAVPARSMDSMREKGAWWVECEHDDFSCKSDLEERSNGDIPTPSHKFEIGSQEIASRMAGFPEAAKTAQTWPCQGLPPWEPPRFSGDPREFPMHLVPYRPVQFVEEGGPFLSWLSELPLVSGNPWPLRAEINPSDAARLGLVDGDQVLIESPVGSCPASVQITEGVRAGAVAMALGKGGAADLVAPDEDRWSGVLAWQGTRVRVKKTS